MRKLLVGIMLLAVVLMGTDHWNLPNTDCSGDGDAIQYLLGTGWFCGDDDGGVGGTPVVMDLENGGPVEVTDLNRLATNSDTNNIFTVAPAPEQILIDLTKDWPKADQCDFADGDGNFVATLVGDAIEELDDVNAGGPNAADGKVEYSQLVGVPASVTSVVKVAEDYAGADFSDQVQAAQDAAPVGGTIVITESHTMTGTINLDQPDTTIVCVPGVVITQNSAPGEKTFSITGARTTIKDCTFQGNKNTVDAIWVTLDHTGDGFTAENNKVYDYRGTFVTMYGTPTHLDDVTFRGNTMDNGVAANLGGITTGSLISGTSGAFRRMRIENNTLLKRSPDGWGDPFGFFCDDTMNCSDITVTHNYMEVRSDAGENDSACVELAMTGGDQPGDFMKGVVFDSNTCVTYDGVFEGWALGDMVGLRFTNNTWVDRSTVDGIDLFGSEFGDIWDSTFDGNTWDGGERSRDALFSNGRRNVISNNSFIYRCNPRVNCSDYGIQIEAGIAANTGDRSEDILVTGNTFKSPTLGAEGWDDFPIALICQGGATLHLKRVTVTGNTFAGNGSPGGASRSAPVAVMDLPATACTISDINVSNNRVNNYDSVVRTLGSIPNITIEGNSVTATAALGFASDPLVNTVIDNVGGKGTLNVRDFGCMGDGTTDDTACLQAAMDEARSPNAGGTEAKNVWIPPGDYLITSTVYMATGVKVEGVKGSSRIVADAAFPLGNDGMFQLGLDHYGYPAGSPGQDMELKSLKFDLSNRAEVGVRLRGMDQPGNLQDLDFSDVAKYAIYSNSDDGDHLADATINGIYVTEYGAAPSAGDRAIYLKAITLFGIDNVTVNGLAGANANSYGIELVMAQPTTVSRITGELWGAACVYSNGAPIYGFGLRCGQAPEAVRLGAVSGGNVLINTYGAPGTGTVAINDTLATYTSGVGGVAAYIQPSDLTEASFWKSQSNKQVKLGASDAPEACNVGTWMEGAIYYDQTLNALCYCDGTNWQAVDADVADTPGTADCH